MMGIYKDKRSGSWVARGKTRNGKREYLGSFKTEEEANYAYAINTQSHQLRPFVIKEQGLLDELELALEPPKQGFFARLFKRKQA